VGRGGDHHRERAVYDLAGDREEGRMRQASFHNKKSTGKGAT
jgi:hypothetical protein